MFEKKNELQLVKLVFLICVFQINDKATLLFYCGGGWLLSSADVIFYNMRGLLWN